MNGSQREKFFEMIDKVKRRNRKANQNVIMKDIQEAVKSAKKQESKQKLRCWY
jgi:hypothetical protein